MRKLSLETSESTSTLPRKKTTPARTRPLNTEVTSSLMDRSPKLERLSIEPTPDETIAPAPCRLNDLWVMRVVLDLRAQVTNVHHDGTARFMVVSVAVLRLTTTTIGVGLKEAPTVVLNND